LTVINVAIIKNRRIAPDGKSGIILFTFQEIQNKKRGNDMFVDLTIYDAPASLLKEFGARQPVAKSISLC